MLRMLDLSPANAVRVELGHAALDAALLVPRAFGFAWHKRKYLEELRTDLERAAPVVEPRECAPSRDRPLELFVACAEVSGEIHAVNVVHALRAALARAGAPAPRLTGFGGAHLQAAGVELRGNPVARARMGFQGIASSLPYYLGLLRDAARAFRDERPDLVLAVDSPALHVPLLRLARRYRVPAVHFVTPQYWGWAPWRTARYRDSVDLALSILPFEPAWFARRAVHVAHVGHPLLDELEHVPRASVPGNALVLLPGSRESVVERNLPWMLRVAERVHRAHPHAPIVVAHERKELEELLRRHVAEAGASAWVQLELGDLHETLRHARAALSVSGTVLLDLLHQRVPSVVVYRLARAREVWLKNFLLTVPWFSSVNLLAGAEIYPEFAFSGEGPLDEVAAALARCYGDSKTRAEIAAGLERAAARLGPAGACRRAAGHALALVCPAPASAHP
jgi:lipid-A-disaccharide synthase